jgi:hypothetical protein
MKCVIFAAALFWGSFVFAQESSGTQIPDTMNSMDSNSISTVTAKKSLRLDLTMYNEEANVNSGNSKNRTLTNTYEVAAKYSLNDWMYVKGVFSQADGKSTTKTATSRTVKDIAGTPEPTLEWGTQSEATPMRYYGGLLYRFDLGAAKSTARTDSPKSGGAAYQPFLGLEADLPGYLLGVETRYTIEDKRITESGPERLIVTEGNKGSVYAFIEQTSKYGPGFGFTYARKQKTNYSQHELDAPGYTKLSAELYLQIPIQKNLTFIPLVNYAQIMDKNIKGENLDRNDALNIVVTGRARF